MGKAIGKKKEILNVEYMPFTQRHKNGKNNYDLTITKRSDVQRITEYMYKDACIFLGRKFERAKLILNDNQRMKVIA